MATLLTGVGYIGAALLRRLAEARPDEAIVALDNFFSTPREEVEAVLPGRAALIEGDVADAAAVARAFDLLEASRVRNGTSETGGEPIDGRGDSRGGNADEIVVFHLAAQPSAAIAARQPEVTERSNLVGARVVLEAARERGARVVFGGSFRVYGDDLVGQTVDEDTPYGKVGDLSHLSKVYVEQLARMLGVDCVMVRLGVTYGLSPIMKTTPAFMTVPNLFCQRATLDEDLQVLEDRPMAFIHVRDAADALLKAASLAQTWQQQPWQVVNAAPEVATIGQVARTVQRLAQARGHKVRIQGAASSEADFRVSSRLNFTRQHALDQDLGEVLDFFSMRG